MAKPDGNPGWASYFVRRGFQVYVVDLPPCGRSNFLTAAHFIHRDLSRVSHTLAASVVESELTAPGKEPAHGQPLVPLRHSRAGMHSKWPGVSIYPISSHETRLTFHRLDSEATPSLPTTAPHSSHCTSTRLSVSRWARMPFELCFTRLGRLF